MDLIQPLVNEWSEVMEDLIVQQFMEIANCSQAQN